MRHFILVLFLAIGCGPEPVYDDDINVQAIPVEEGELQGVFAAQNIATSLVHVPIFGDEDGGGINYLLIHRVYDFQKKTYSQRTKVCGGHNFTVMEVANSPSTHAYQMVPESVDETLDVDHQRGIYQATGHVQLWGLRQLENPLSSPIPTTKKQARNPPLNAHVYDMDGDGKEGVTSVVTGLVDGEVYFLQRKRVTFKGVTLGPNRSLGLSQNQYETIFLGDTISIWDPGEGAAEVHPNPKKSWFEEVRLADDASCATVLQAVEDGTLSKSRPF